MPRSSHGGRHELGQNFLHHTPTIRRITELVAETSGPVLEIGAGDGALTARLAALRRPVTAIDLDERRITRLRRMLPGVRVTHADALAVPYTTPVIVGNIPFHLTTPILRRLISRGSWRDAILLTQWEVARKRAGVGGGTMLSAQAAPWFAFELIARVPARCFTPMPSVDGGIIRISRRRSPLVPMGQRRDYERFARLAFTGTGGSLATVLSRASGAGRSRAQRAMNAARVDRGSLPRDVSPEQWASLWHGLT